MLLVERNREPGCISRLGARPKEIALLWWSLQHTQRSLPEPLRHALQLLSRRPSLPPCSFKSALAFACTARGEVAHELVDDHNELVANSITALWQRSRTRPKWADVVPGGVPPPLVESCGPRRVL